MHVALAEESVVECECGREFVRCLSLVCNLEIVPQQLFVVGMSAVLNDGLCAFAWRLSSQVGYTLLCDDDVDVVLCVVDMAAEWHNRADDSSLGY